MRRDIGLSVTDGFRGKEAVRVTFNGRAGNDRAELCEMFHKGVNGSLTRPHSTGADSVVLTSSESGTGRPAP